MKDDLQNKTFSGIGILSYLKGKDPDMIIRMFKKQAEFLQPKRKHEIRQKILNSENMSFTLSFSGDLKVTLNHLTYEYKDYLDAVCLQTCKDYHSFHIKYIAEEISKHGAFSCDFCRIPCEYTNQIVLNAFVASYFQKIQNYQGSTLILKKEKIGSMFREDRQKQAIQSQEKTVISTNQDGVYCIVQVKVLQIDIKDKRLNNVDTEQVAEKLQEIGNEERSKQFQERQLVNSTGQILVNLVCFRTQARIRNAVIHKDCKPSDHKNRLILYSFQQVLAVVTQKQKKKKKVKCVYPYCSNYFDQSNFYQVAVVIQNIHNIIYEEYKECMFGEYFAGMYQKNWHYYYAENMLMKSVKNKQLVGRYMEEIRISVQSLLKTANLKIKKKKVYTKLEDAIEDNQQLDDSIKLFTLDRDAKIVIVDIGQSNLCPVRCINCKNLNSMDAFRISYLYKSSAESICPICTQQLNKRQASFSDNFYIDLKLMEFVFLEGHNRQIYYDVKIKQYFHKLSFYTGRSLKEKLKQENKVVKGLLYKSQMDVKLPKNVRYVPFMDRRCAEKATAEDYNKHFIYIVDGEKIKEDTTCPHCKRQVRSDYLQYNQELDSILKAKGNTLRWAAKAQDEMFSIDASILSIKYYNDIKNEYKIKEEKRQMKFYWKNYEGTLIKYPIKFRGCVHPFETTICDFSDILYQSKVEKLTKFKCRFKGCNNEYANAQDLQRVSLDIYSKIEENPEIMRRIINNNEYWISFNIEESNIIKTARMPDDSKDQVAEQAIIDQYRNRFSDNFQDLKNRKDIHMNLKKTEDDIEYTKQRIKDDEEEFKANGVYKHSDKDSDFQALKVELKSLIAKKERLEKQKRQLASLELQSARKSNNTKNLNFAKLAKMYQPQVNALKQKKAEQDIFANLQPQDFSNYKTYGNLFPFKYPVPKAQTLAAPPITIQDLLEQHGLIKDKK